jgi:hypothetical protein
MSKNQIISIRQNDNFDDIEIVPFEDMIETKTLDEVLHDDEPESLNTPEERALPAPEGNDSNDQQS